MSTKELVIQSEVTIEDYSHGFLPAICQLVGAIANRDGVVTAEEYQAVVLVNKNLVSIVDSPLLINTLTLRAILEPPDFNDAIKLVRKSAKDKELELKQYVVQCLQPILSIQGVNQETILKPIMKALELEKSSVIGEFTQSLSSGMKNMLARRTPYNKIRDFSLAFNDKRLLEVLEECDRNIKSDAFQRALSVSKENAINSCQELEKRNHDLDLLQLANEQLSSMADTMIEQTKRRLNLLQRRAAKQKTHFEEDVDTMLDDTQLELEKIWKDRVARLSGGKQPALHKPKDDQAVLVIRQRIDSIRNRYDSIMEDWSVEYESFCNELADSKKIFLSARIAKNSRN